MFKQKADQMAEQHYAAASFSETRGHQPDFLVHSEPVDKMSTKRQNQLL
jgi:hypothetical protein